MTSRWDYWNGTDEEDRRVKYAKVFKPEFQLNGDDTQRRIESVVTAFRGETGIEIPTGYVLGWQPPSVTGVSANMDQVVTHLTAQAGNKRDTIDGVFAWWCLRTPHVLEVHGLYIEHPVATVVRSWKKASEEQREPTPWCHLQSIPPGSHSRIYWPDGSAFSEWQRFEADGGYAGMAYKAWQATQIQPPTRSRAKKSVDL